MTDRHHRKYAAGILQATAALCGMHAIALRICNMTVTRHTDYLGIDEDACDFFLHGWYEKAQEVIEQYGDRFGKLMKANE